MSVLKFASAPQAVTAEHKNTLQNRKHTAIPPCHRVPHFTSDRPKRRRHAPRIGRFKRDTPERPPPCRSVSLVRYLARLTFAGGEGSLLDDGDKSFSGGISPPRRRGSLAHSKKRRAVTQIVSTWVVTMTAVQQRGGS